MTKQFTSEVFDYLLYYGFALLFMPFIYMIALGVLLSPLLILSSVGPESISSFADSVSLSVYPYISYVLGFGLFILYIFLTKKIHSKYKRVRVGLFVIVFVSSAIINFLFSYFICLISVLKSCDPTRYLTPYGLIEIYDFYVISLLAFIGAYFYMVYTSRHHK